MMTEETKKNLQTTQRRVLRMIIQTERKIHQKSTAAAKAANVEVDVDDERQDPNSEPEDDTTKSIPQDIKEQEKVTATWTTPSISSVPQDDETTEDEPEPWFEHSSRNLEGGRRHESQRDQTMDPLTEQRILQTGQNYCHAPRRSLDMAHSETQQTKVRGDDTDLTNDMMWFTAALDGLKLDSMERDFVNSRHPQPTRPASQQQARATSRHVKRDTKKSTNESHDEGDDNNTLLFVSQIIEN